jgi:hypothetical protein
MKMKYRHGHQPWRVQVFLRRGQAGTDDGDTCKFNVDTVLYLQVAMPGISTGSGTNSQVLPARSSGPKGTLVGLTHSSPCAGVELYTAAALVSILVFKA